MGNENYMRNQLMKGSNLLTRNDYNAGLICFNKAINNITDKTDKVTSAKAFKHRGLCQQKLGSYSKALTDLKNSETLNSGDIPIYYNLGHLLYTMEEYNESRETLKKFLSKLKGSNIEDSDYLKQESYKYLALIESQLKNLKEAIEYIDTALKLSGNKEEFIYLKGVIYLENNNFDLALSEFNKISEESNEFLEALNGKISIYEKKNDYESAITMITELEKKYPKKDTFSYNHGIILLKQKKYDAAIEKFTKNIGLLNRENLDDQAKEKLSLNYTARAYCYLSLKKDKDALSDSRKSLTLIPLSLNATYFLSRCLLNKSPLTNEIYDELFDTKAFYIVNTLQKILFEPESESKKKFIEKVREVFFKEFYNPVNTKNNDTIDLSKTYYVYKDINEYTIDSLDNKGIYRNNPTTYNDPFDPYFKCFNMELSDLLGTIRISCLTETYNNLLFWAHYGKYHTGICIGYKIKGLNNYTYFNKIKYESLKTNSKFSLFPIDTDKSVNTIHDIFVKKHPDWNYEKEHRLLHLPNEEDNGNYFKNIEITEIIFGLKCDSNKRTEISERYTHYDIKFYEMVEDKDLTLQKIPYEKK